MIQSSEFINNNDKISKMNLEKCAYGMTEKYQSGGLPELKQIGWPVAWKYLLKDLRICCPGFSEIEYGIALNKAFIDSK
jgi:hypothetical protein